MADNSDKDDEGRDEQHPSDYAAERRFNETVRNLLNTPHKPHKAKATRLTVLADVDELLEAIAAVDVSDGLIQPIESRIDLLHSTSELVKIESDSDAATRTGILRVYFEPSDRLRDLVAAARAGNL